MYQLSSVVKRTRLWLGKSCSRVQLDLLRVANFLISSPKRLVNWYFYYFTCKQPRNLQEKKTFCRMLHLINMQQTTVFALIETNHDVINQPVCGPIVKMFPTDALKSLVLGWAKGGSASCTAPSQSIKCP